ncbi:MAG: hypothetical protein NG747_10905 [Candidatus Brocadia sp.]|nr:hypothetical protein [Candidatus Brocadia sp.]NUO08190.1 hypothetical protein [Candidatus Brocadia sp.]
MISTHHFIAAEPVNALATSGSSTTTLAPSCDFKTSAVNPYGFAPDRHLYSIINDMLFCDMAVVKGN